jgi:hypothetical protein
MATPERHHLPSHQQIRHVPVQVDPIQVLHIQDHMPVEQITHRRNRHDKQPGHTRQLKPAPPRRSEAKPHWETAE